jgi:hypothetical protein
MRPLATGMVVRSLMPIGDEGAAMETWARIRPAAPWLFIGILVVLPLYALALVFTIRAGVWSPTGAAPTAQQITAVFAFLGVGLTRRNTPPWGRAVQTSLIWSG